MNDLANVYRFQSKSSEAEVLLKQCLDVRKAVLGGSHPSTLFTMSRLAVTCNHQRKHSEAEVLFKQCLAKQKVVLGENHPSTLNTMNNLAATSRALSQKLDES